MALDPLQKALNKQARATIQAGGRKLIVCGKVATLLYLGLEPDVAVRDISQAGVDRAYIRKATKRARWYGDSGGSNVPATAVQMVSYPYSAGGATPGRPIQFEALTDTNNDPRGRKVAGTVELSGPFGWFIHYLTENRPTHSVRIKNPRGHWLEAPVLSAQDYASLPTV